MRRPLILAVVVIAVMAFSLSLPDSGITGFFVKVGATGLAIAKSVLKTILTSVLAMLG